MTGWGIGLDYCDMEWFPGKRIEIIVIFESVPKYCISDSSVDYDGYFISSEGFLPTVVLIMVI